MFNRTNCSLLSIGMIFKEFFEICFKKLSKKIIHASVFFLIDCFQLRLKKSKHRSDKTMTINFKPFFYLISWKFILIGNSIIRCKCINPCSSHCFYHSIKFIRNGKIRSFDWQSINIWLNFYSFIII